MLPEGIILRTVEAGREIHYNWLEIVRAWVAHGVDFLSMPTLLVGPTEKHLQFGPSEATANSSQFKSHSQFEPI